MEQVKKFKLKEYKEYPYTIKDIFLNISINEAIVNVASQLVLSPKFKDSQTLVLKGTDIVLHNIKIDGKTLSRELYTYENKELIIYNPPNKPFKLDIQSSINPYTNTSLEGMYDSRGIIATQCEAEGFRRICFHPDRPDVLSKYKVRIEANKNKHPILLSNGNNISSSTLSENENRHESIWEDPFPKPSYLFALVAGQLTKVTSIYKTFSEKEISINIYVEKGDEKYTQHAIDSLKKAMSWDEKVYKLEYDLNLYNIVAIRHFNMGAMENKSLNIFNSKLVLADSKITTDIELERIESVIAHEYFHNWTGNRITCRDWFQLSLKEGLTVYRDQSFTEDLHSSAIKRIEDVSLLRNIQFKEDSGPTSHPVKPPEYIAIDNFYTTTIYEKGAEIIRMLKILLGKYYFFCGIRKYVNDYDGSAATTEDFVNSVIQGAKDNGHKLNFSINQFNEWYYQSGTPYITIKREWDENNNSLKLIFSQSNNSNITNNQKPLVIPIKAKIINSNKPNDEKLLILDDHTKVFEFNNLSTNKVFPIPSLFRNFSAPVIWDSDLRIEELIYISDNDDDLFSRWNTLNYLTRKVLLLRASDNINNSLEELLVSSFKSNINTYLDTNPGFISKLLKIPHISELELYQNPINPITLNKACYDFKSFLGISLQDSLITLLGKCNEAANLNWPDGQGERKLLEVIWSLLIINGNISIRKEALEAVRGPSMTLSKAALNSLIQTKSKERDQALEIFYEKWKNNPIVLDSWFNMQSSIDRENSIEFVNELLNHPLFDPIAPNSIRAVLGGFSQNINTFHSIDGKGYLFMAEQIAKVDQRNAITASRMIKVFGQWGKYIEPNQLMMLKAINKLKEYKLSSNTREILDLIINKTEG